MYDVLPSSLHYIDPNTSEEYHFEEKWKKKERRNCSFADNSFWFFPLLAQLLIAILQIGSRRFLTTINYSNYVLILGFWWVFHNHSRIAACCIRDRVTYILKIKGNGWISSQIQELLKSSGEKYEVSTTRIEDREAVFRWECGHIDILATVLIIYHFLGTSSTTSLRMSSTLPAFVELPMLIGAKTTEKKQFALT